MKKLLSFVLCVIIVLIGTASISAAEIGVDDLLAASAATDSLYDYTIIKTETLPDNYVRFYLQGGDINTDAGIILINAETGQQINYSLDSTNLVDMYKPDASEYKCMVTFKEGKIAFNVNSTGSTYQLIKLKLSDFDSHFNEDGSITQEIDGISHNYNFTDEGNGFYSHLPFFSGNAITVAAPDKDGYVSLYVSTKLGERTKYWTDFFMEGSKTVVGINSSLSDLTIGNVDKKVGVNIDDATAVQKYMADIINFDSLSLRNADANQDGKIDIDDVTLIQKYVAGFEV